MATTTTLFNILDAKLHRLGYDGIYDREHNRIIEAGDVNSNIYQLSSFTDLAYQAVNSEVFSNYIIKSKEADRHFKHIFTSKFLLKEIKFQTLDIFRAKATAMLVADEQHISNLYELYDMMVRNYATGKTTASANKNGTKAERNANSTLPQDNTELNLNDDVVKYADETRYNKEKHQDNEISLQNTENETYNPDSLLKLKDEWDLLLSKYQKELFLQVWY